MSLVAAEYAAEFDGSAARAYETIADYEKGHPSILPSRWFSHLDVERGGRGAGTVIRFGMRAGGRTHEARAHVTEPEPGRVLMETVEDERNTITTFTVEPLAGQRVRVTIRTTWEARGLRGAVERLVAPRLLRRIYREELANLARVTASSG